MSDNAGKACILVTGGTGFVGGWLTQALRSQMPAAEIIPTSLSKAPGSVVLDISRKDDVDAVIARYRPDAVVHLAALSSLGEAAGDPIAAYSVNLFGALHIAQSMRQHVRDSRLIFVGSSEVYGRTFNRYADAVHEDAPLEPMNTYASTKAAADLLIGQLAMEGLQAVRFRPFNHTGPGQSDRFVVPAFVRQIVAAENGLQEPIIRVGNLDSIRDFMDVRDVVRAYISALTITPPLPRGTILNLASGMPRRIGDLLELLLSMARIKLTVKVDQDRIRPSEIAVAVGDARHAERLLGWKPEIPIEQTLGEMLEYTRKSQGASRQN